MISWSTMWWLNGLFRVGFRKLMTYDDIDNLDNDLKSENVGPKMIDAWNKRCKINSLPKYSIISDTLQRNLKENVVYPSQ